MRALGTNNLEDVAPEQKHMIPHSSSMPTGSGGAPAPTHMPTLPSVEGGTFTSSPFTNSMPPHSIAEKPAKRAKLSSADKEAKRIEKEEKDRLKAEEKSQERRGKGEKRGGEESQR